MATPKSDNIQLNAPKPLDDRHQLFSSVAVALSSDQLDPLGRYIGQIVYAFNELGVVTEFWFRDGILDSQLIVKSTSSSSVVLPISSQRYNSQDVIDSDDTHSVIIPELIGADLRFFRAYRGNGSSLSGYATVATEDSVQVDVLTGKVTFFNPFDPTINEKLAFDYLPGSVTPPTPGNGYFIAGYVADGYTV